NTAWRSPRGAPPHRRRTCTRLPPWPPSVSVRSNSPHLRYTPSSHHRLDLGRAHGDCGGDLVLYPRPAYLGTMEPDPSAFDLHIGYAAACDCACPAASRRPACSRCCPAASCTRTGLCDLALICVITYGFSLTFARVWLVL